MKFGITVPYTIARKVAATALLTEQAGWDGFFLGDSIWCSDPMIALAAAAMVTTRIRLGTYITPVPIRIPQKLASESVALDHLSNGRMTLGLATGATWMGWQSFPNEVLDTKVRAEMLDEMIDVLTLLYQRKQFDYNGKHYQILLTRMEEIHYPPKPIQQPRIPLWVVGVWPRMKSMRRVLKADGIIPGKMSLEGKFTELNPVDLCQIKSFVEANRLLKTQFDYICEGQTVEMSHERIQSKIGPWKEAGATWWIESLYGINEDKIMARIEQGPPNIQ